MGVRFKHGGTLSSLTKGGPGPGAYDPNFNSANTELPKYSIKGRYVEPKRD